jgi:hypothetical protein
MDTKTALELKKIAAQTKRDLGQIRDKAILDLRKTGRKV